MSTCGNENKHYLPPTEPKDVADALKDTVITCTLEAKHAGDHSAPYPEQDESHRDSETGKMKFMFWSDAANVAPKDRKYEKGAKKAKAPVKEK